MIILLAGATYAVLAGAALSFDTSAETGVPTTDAAFASKVVKTAVAGRTISEVVDDLRASGFTCFEHENRVVSNSERSVTFQKHVCGGAVPALHGCARNAELGSFDGILKHITISLEHPDGTPNNGIACFR